MSKEEKVKDTAKKEEETKTPSKTKAKTAKTKVEAGAKQTKNKMDGKVEEKEALKAKVEKKAKRGLTEEEGHGNIQKLSERAGPDGDKKLPKAAKRTLTLSCKSDNIKSVRHLSPDMNHENFIV